VTRGGFWTFAHSPIEEDIGRRDSQFKDGNEDLIDRVLGQYPGLKTLEMETSMLLALSHLTTTDKLYVSGVAMVFANRVDNSFIDKALVADLELKAGKGVLETLLHFPLEKGTSTGS
jgi:uridine phosphorylase